MENQNNRYVNSRFCDERHRAIEKQLADLKEWIAKIDSKLWKGLGLLTLNLIGLLTMLITEAIK